MVSLAGGPDQLTLSYLGTETSSLKHFTDRNFLRVENV